MNHLWAAAPYDITAKNITQYESTQGIYICMYIPEKSHLPLGHHSFFAVSSFRLFLFFVFFFVVVFYYKSEKVICW